MLTTELYDGKVADIWSCGVMLYVLLVGTFPFARQGDEDMKNAKALQMMFGRIIKADYEAPDVRPPLTAPDPCPPPVFSGRNLRNVHGQGPFARQCAHTALLVPPHAAWQELYRCPLVAGFLIASPQCLTPADPCTLPAMCPKQVSEECKSLLRGLLTADPAKRLTVAQVQSHPWFLQDLPAGALEVNSRLKLMDNVRWIAHPAGLLNANDICASLTKPWSHYQRACTCCQSCDCTSTDSCHTSEGGSGLLSLADMACASRPRSRSWTSSKSVSSPGWHRHS